MPPKRKAQAPKKLKQTTLFDVIRSSPSQPPHHPGFSPSKTHSSPIKKRKLYDSTVSTLICSDDEDSDVAAIKFEPKAPIEIADSDEDPDSAPRLFMKKRATRIVDSESDDNEQGESTGARNRKSSPIQLFEIHDDEGKPPMKRRHLLKGKRPPHPATVSDEGSADEVNEEHILNSRFRSRGKQTLFQKNLEKLKRRKQGKPIEQSDSENSNEEDGSEDSEPMPFKGAAPSNDRDSLFDDSSEGSEVDNFIVEDDGTEVAALPTQFSMETHQDIAHQFKKIFQFFVHVAVRAPQERREFMQRQMREEEYFYVPLEVTRRKISGLRDSLVASSVWRPEFKKALEKFPDFELISLDFAIPYCDACHLGGRMSTLIGRVSGTSYDRIGFEEVQEDLDSDGSSVSEHESSGNKNDFHLGRFCARRTRVYHEFSHWEHSLFSCIRQEVEDLHQSLSSNSTGKKFSRVAFAGGKQPPEDLDDADGICEWLDERRVIDMEWQKIKAMMESARHLEMASKRGEND